MKRGPTILLVIGLLLAGFAIFLVVSIGADKYLSDKKSETECPANRPNHLVIIKNDAVNPVTTTAPRCDTLTIKNADSKSRLIGLGEHDRHQAYDGVSQRNLANGESFTLTLYKTGTYNFHDHYQDEVGGSFTVK